MQATESSAGPQGSYPGCNIAPIASAERELGAFLCAVQRQFGPQVTGRAGIYWIEALEAIDRPSRNLISLRRITILAASRLARDSERASPDSPD
jgi:hypothetical protein